MGEVDISLLKTTIKRHLHECKYRGFRTRCKPLVTLKIRKVRLDFDGKHLEEPEEFWKNKYKKKNQWINENKVKNDGKK